MLLLLVAFQQHRAAEDLEAINRDLLAMRSDPLPAIDPALLPYPDARRWEAFFGRADDHLRNVAKLLRGALDQKADGIEVMSIDIEEPRRSASRVAGLGRLRVTGVARNTTTERARSSVRAYQHAIEASTSEVSATAVTESDEERTDGGQPTIVFTIGAVLTVPAPEGI